MPLCKLGQLSIFISSISVLSRLAKLKYLSVNPFCIFSYSMLMKIVKVFASFRADFLHDIRFWEVRLVFKVNLVTYPFGVKISRIPSLERNK